MEVGAGHTIVGMTILPYSPDGGQDEASSPAVLLVTAQGLGKRLPASSFNLQKRGGMGTIGIRCNPGDKLVALHVVCPVPLACSCWPILST